MSKLIYDEDYDSLNFTLVDSNDEAVLEKYGLSFSWIRRAIIGQPIMKGTLPMMKVRATDIHGYYTEAFFNIKIEDYLPIRTIKTSDKIFKDQVIIKANSDYSF